MAAVTLHLRPQTGSRAPPQPGFERAREVFPWVAIESPVPAKVPTIWLAVAAWRDSTFDAWAFDRALDRANEAPEPAITLVGASGELPGAALEVLTRAQRAITRRNRASATQLFAHVLGRHRDLHNSSLPLVQADLDHAHDVWQWTLRLDPQASLAVQLAALYHDIERLASESVRRVEQRSSDYQAFKHRHAQRGAILATTHLRAAGVPETIVRDVAQLIAGHERPAVVDENSRQTDLERDLSLLGDADALSFFSLNSAGFADYYGPEHTQRKVAYSLARIRRSARHHLEQMWIRPDVRAMIPQ